MDVPIVKQTMRTIGCKAAKQIWCEADLWDSVSRGAGAVQRAPEALYQWETVRKKQTQGKHQGTVQQNSRWQPPKDGYVKCNVDAMLFGN